LRILFIRTILCNFVLTHGLNVWVMFAYGCVRSVGGR
jgi:hypothetical protein